MVASEFPPGPGGIGSHAWSLARQLWERGWQVRVVASQDYATAQEIAAFNRATAFPIHSLPRHRWSPREGLAWLGSLRQVMRAFRPEVGVASGSRAVWVAAVAFPWSATPWLAVGHGSEFSPALGWRGRATRWACGRAHALVAVSSYTARLMTDFGLAPEAITVISNGADGDFFRPLPESEAHAFRAQLGLEHAFILLTVGSVTQRKGQDVVVAALPRVLHLDPPVHYLVVGLPTQGDRLMAEARRLGVAERVHLTGPLDRQALLAAYAASDLFVMMSRATPEGDVEGFGIAAVEAALCGKAALVSAGSGLAEAVVHEQTGLLVPAGDPEAVATEVARLHGDRLGLAKLGQQARLRAQAEQTWAQRAEEYDALLQALARGGAAGQAAGRG